MIWTQKHSLQALQDICKNTLCEHLDMRFTEIGDDYLVATMPVDSRTHQPAGLLHGGASVALAESLGSIASAMCISNDKMPVGIEINASHIRSIRSGLVTGRVTPIKIGKTLHLWNIEIRDEAQNLLCTSRLSVMIVDRKLS